VRPAPSTRRTSRTNGSLSQHLPPVAHPALTALSQHLPPVAHPALTALSQHLPPVAHPVGVRLQPAGRVPGGEAGFPGAPGEQGAVGAVRLLQGAVLVVRHLSFPSTAHPSRPPPSSQVFIPHDDSAYRLAHARGAARANRRKRSVIRKISGSLVHEYSVVRALMRQVREPWQSEGCCCASYCCTNTGDGKHLAHTKCR
jgi:hypothetical protein